MDNECLTDLYRKYGPTIYARCFRILVDRSAAEDATQEVFIRMARHRDKALVSEEALLWLYRVATNHCLNELRNGKRRAQLKNFSEDDVRCGEDAALKRDFARRILRRAPERLRDCAWLHHVDGMSHEEIGRKLGLSRRTIINHLAEFDSCARKFALREG